MNKRILACCALIPTVLLAGCGQSVRSHYAACGAEITRHRNLEGRDIERIHTTPAINQCVQIRQAQERHEQQQASNAVAMGLVAGLAGAAAGASIAAASRPVYYPTYHRPVTCNSFRYGPGMSTTTCN